MTVFRPGCFTSPYPIRNIIFV